jgi:hypothetical protein
VTERTGPGEQLHCGVQLRRVERVLSERIKGVVVKTEAVDRAEMVFTHPLHDTLIKIVVCQSLHKTLPATVSISVFVAPWLDLAANPDSVAKLLLANARLQGCATAVDSIDDYDKAVVLVRCTPIEGLEPQEVMRVIDDIVWEWAELSTTGEDAAGDAAAGATA